MSGIKSRIQDVTNAVTGVADKIRSVLHFSVPDEGPLSDADEYMPDFMKLLATGIKKNVRVVVKAVRGLASSMSGIANIIDTQILQNGAAIRTAVVFFYLANEGLSCLENAAVIGLPVPDKLKEMLAQLKEEKNKDE